VSQAGERRGIRPSFATPEPEGCLGSPSGSKATAQAMFAKGCLPSFTSTNRHTRNDDVAAPVAWEGYRQHQTAAPPRTTQIGREPQSPGAVQRAREGSMRPIDERRTPWRKFVPAAASAFAVLALVGLASRTQLVRSQATTR
jgi:hypothetical protein